MNQSEQINELASALAKMQREVGPIHKNKTAKIPMKSGGSFSFSYADLAGIIEATRKSLADNGLSLTQTFCLCEAGYQMVTTLMHSSGQWIKSILPIDVRAVDIKQLGSQITYSRRYALTALLGICADDDDEGVLEGNATTQSSTPAQTSSDSQSKAFITKSEANKLEHMLSMCGEPLQTNIRVHIQSKMNVQSFDKLTRNQYDAIKKRVDNELGHESEVISA